jgi:hypothetical protein
VEALTEDMNSAWLPEKITVESTLLDKRAEFIFNLDGHEVGWVTKKGGPVTVVCGKNGT